MNTQPDYFTRVYTPTRAKLAHLLPPGDTTALCGRSLWGVQSSDWGGTGSQEEYDKAAALPLCSRCEYRSRETL